MIRSARSSASIWLMAGLCSFAVVFTAGPAMAAPASPHVLITLPVGDGPSGLAVNSVTKRTYVADFRSNQLSVIDETSKTIQTITVGSGPAAVGANETTNRVYVANQNGGVTVVDGSNNQIITTVPMGGLPDGVAVVPSTNLIYVTNFLSR